MWSISPSQCTSFSLCVLSHFCRSWRVLFYSCMSFFAFFGKLHANCRQLRRDEGCGFMNILEYWFALVKFEVCATGSQLNSKQVVVLGVSLVSAFPILCSHANAEDCCVKSECLTTCPPPLPPAEPDQTALTACRKEIGRHLATACHSSPKSIGDNCEQKASCSLVRMDVNQCLLGLKWHLCQRPLELGRSCTLESMAVPPWNL